MIGCLVFASINSIEPLSNPTERMSLETQLTAVIRDESSVPQSYSICPLVFIKLKINDYNMINRYVEIREIDL